MIAVLLLHLSSVVWNSPIGRFNLPGQVELPKFDLKVVKNLLPVILIGVTGLVFNTLCLANVDASFFQVRPHVPYLRKCYTYPDTTWACIDCSWISTPHHNRSDSHPNAQNARLSCHTFRIHSHVRFLPRYLPSFVFHLHPGCPTNGHTLYLLWNTLIILPRYTRYPRQVGLRLC